MSGVGVILWPLAFVLAVLVASGSVIAGIYLTVRLNGRSGRSSSGVVVLSVVLALFAVPLTASILFGAVGMTLGRSSTVEESSAGPAFAEVSVPDLVGLDETTAKRRLLDLGLTVLVRYRSESAVAPGSVVAQDPAPGSTETSGATVTLTVAAVPSPTAPSP